MVSATLSFFPAFSSVYSTYLSSALSKGQSNFFIQPMKATHRQNNLLYQTLEESTMGDSIPGCGVLSKQKGEVSLYDSWRQDCHFWSEVE